MDLRNVGLQCDFPQPSSKQSNKITKSSTAIDPDSQEKEFPKVSSYQCLQQMI